MNKDGTYDDAEAVRIMDAWWPRWMTAEFKPTLGNGLFEAIRRIVGFHDAPGPVGSAFITGWYGCAKALIRSLDDALDHATDAELYPDGPCEKGDAQWCNDAVRHTATGAITQPPIHWIDRPTFQQAIQIK